jgi:hypothetical protein
MIRAVAVAEQFDPRDCRRSVEERFSPANMVDAYLEVFQRLIREHGFSLVPVHHGVGTSGRLSD